MAPRLLKMPLDGPRIAQDATRMSQGLHQDASRMVPRLLRMHPGRPQDSQDGFRIAEDAPRMSRGLSLDAFRMALGWPG